jgi:putative autotransporter adhesin-like protein
LERNIAVKKFVLLLVLLAMGTACHIGRHSGVAGSGKRQREKRDVKAFTSISTEGAFDIQVVCQKQLSVEVEGDDNILPLVSTEVSNNVLHVRNVRGYSVSEPIVLRIAVPDLEGISSSGAGTIDIASVKNEKFVIDVNGAPTVKASGETKELTIDANGAGKIDAHRLRGARVQVESKGVSTVEVYASEQLDVTVSGPSHVIYQGNAVVHQTVNGPGSVEKRESEGARHITDPDILFSFAVPN